MADQNNKVIHYKNRWHGSVIGFLFLFIFIYLAVQLYFFFTKEKISIFEVQEKALYSIATAFIFSYNHQLENKYTKTRSHTDGFGENNAKCLKSKEVHSFVPDPSISGF